MIQEGFLRCLIETFDRTSKYAAVALEEHLSKGEDVFWAMAEGRHLDADRVQPCI